MLQYNIINLRIFFRSHSFTLVNTRIKGKHNKLVNGIELVVLPDILVACFRSTCHKNLYLLRPNFHDHFPYYHLNTTLRFYLK
jgi:hypothetical protein